MNDIIGTVLLIIGILFATLGVLKIILIREQQKATVILIEFLLANYKNIKG